MGLTTPAWLADHRDDSTVVIADVRWSLAGPSGRTLSDQGHIPGAHFVDLDRDLAAPKGRGPGRHPLPDEKDFARVLSRIGVRRESRVVAYDGAGGAIAARLWWLLRYFGVGGGSVLDGGLAAWQALGGELTEEEPSPVDAPLLELNPNRALVAEATEVEMLREHGRAVILDARALERYEGREEPIDPRPGHIPGARSAPFAENLEGGRMRPADELAARYRELGALEAETIVAYCGSGVTACHDLLALTLVGRDDAKLDPGSWSDWSSDPSRPAATGPDRS